jgi:hypothetical protein
MPTELRQNPAFFPRCPLVSGILGGFQPPPRTDDHDRHPPGRHAGTFKARGAFARLLSASADSGAFRPADGERVGVLVCDANLDLRALADGVDAAAA